MKRRSISVSIDAELIEWLDRIAGPTMRRRSQTLEQFCRIFKESYETGGRSLDPVLRVAAVSEGPGAVPSQSRKVSGRDYGRHVIPFPGAPR